MKNQDDPVTTRWSAANIKVAPVRMINTVFILTGNTEAREWLRALILDIFPRACVTSLGSIKEARSNIMSWQFDLALVDLGLPDVSGAEIVNLLEKLRSACLTVVATAFDDNVHLFPVPETATEGCRLKAQGAPKFVHLLKGIANGSPPLPPVITRRLLDCVRPGGEMSGVRLTNREKEVLTLIAKGLKLAEISAMLSITENTVAGYVKTIYRKLDISSRAEATLAATRFGLVHPY